MTVQQATNGCLEHDLVILHFNDVYNIEESSQEPVGGAGRMATKMKSFAAENPLILFSGDAYNPSILSIVTKGKQMVEVLNALGVHMACIGNHDFDYGVANMMEMCRQCSFPWLMANVLDKETGEPLGGLAGTAILDWQGVRIGFVGVVEEDWITTLPAVGKDDVSYLDAVESGRKAAAELRAQGAQLLIALTHMRLPNDRIFAANAPEYDLVLGGHDHDYVVEEVPHSQGEGSTLLVKSGTNFRDMTEIRVHMDPLGGRPRVKSWTEHKITKEVPQDPAVQAIVDSYQSKLGAKLDEIIGESAVDLDGRFATVRTRESNLGNFVADVFREASRADIAILNSGSLRSDIIHTAGPITARDLLNILPIMDPMLLLEVGGATLLQALENGVSQYPKLEGRFLQVSGIKFAFDPSKPPGERILRDTVYVHHDEACEKLQLDTKYTLATKEYLVQGKDGFECLMECKVLRDAESSPLLPTVIRNVFQVLEVINQFNKIEQTVRRAVTRLRRRVVEHSRVPMQERAESYISILDPATGRYMISPHVDGRIVCVAES